MKKPLKETLITIYVFKYLKNKYNNSVQPSYGNELIVRTKINNYLKLTIVKINLT